MKPITREEMYLAAAAGEYSGELPEPKTRLEYYLKKIKEAVENGSSVAPEDIDAAIEAYLNSHDADIVTEKELSDALAGYYDKDAVDTALNEKQNMLTAGDNISIETVNGELTISATDTTYSDATQQIHGLMSTADKTKLDGITAAKMTAWDAAEQNVNADWNAESGDAQILNKPDLTVYALADDVTTALGGKVDKETGRSLMTADEHTKLNNIEVGAQVNTVTGVKGANEAEYRTGNISISKGNVGLGNVDNTADADKPISTAAQTALDNKVDKITGKGLSEANFTDAEKTKLAGIATGAEVNVQSDWNQGDDSADDYIKNKPANLVQDASYVHTDNNFTNAEKAKADGAIQSTEKGAANGVAELNANGKVPTSQLPAYVDDVLSYNSLSDFPATGEDGKIYIAKDTNLSYRWGSSEYVVISPSLALGSTSSTAYRGDWGAEDRAAIGTLSTLNTTEKTTLVGAINELKTASDAKQGTLTFDNVPTSGSENPVKSGGIYTALAGKQDTLTIDFAPISGSDNPVKSGGVYTALSGKQNTLTFDSTPTENSTNPVTSGGIFSALSGKVDAEANKGLSTNDYTTAEKTKLGGIATGAEVNVQSDWNQSDTTADDFIKNKPTNVSASAAGLMSAADKTKLDGIAAGAQVNQNAFSNVKVGGTTVAADAKQDTIELVAGNNITITPDATNDMITFSATDTTYPYNTNMFFDENYKTQFRTQTKGDAYSGGYISNIKVSGADVDSAPQYGAGLAFGTTDTNGYINMNYNADGFYVGGGSVDKLKWTSRVYTTNYKPTKSDVGLGNVANLDQSRAIVDITRSGTVFTATKLDGTTFTFTQQDNNTTYSNATSSAAGLMSAADKIKLNGCKVIVTCTQAEYEALAAPDANTVYLIPEETT